MVFNRDLKAHLLAVTKQAIDSGDADKVASIVAELINDCAKLERQLGDKRQDFLDRAAIEIMGEGRNAATAYYYADQLWYQRSDRIYKEIEEAKKAKP